MLVFFLSQEANPYVGKYVSCCDHHIEHEIRETDETLPLCSQCPTRILWMLQKNSEYKHIPRIQHTIKGNAPDGQLHSLTFVFV